MIRSWSEIRHFYEKLVASGAPLGGILRLVEHIEASRYKRGIFGWTSMYDLAITQSTEWSYPNIEPYLSIAPQHNGRLEFRYIDTHLAARQWVRVVDEGNAFDRLERFFDDLHWYGRI